MKRVSLKSVEREKVGKGGARSLRRKGYIPAVLYGPGSESIKLSVEALAMNRLIRNAKTSQFLLDLDINGIIKKVTIKELQRNPLFSNILHVDFYEVDLNRKIKVKVPISTTGKCVGVEYGGMLQVIRREVEVFCLPIEIPEQIKVDVSDLNVGDSLHLGDLHLPRDIDFFGDPNLTVLTVLNQKIIESETEDEVDQDIESNIEESEG